MQNIGWPRSSHPSIWIVIMVIGPSVLQSKAHRAKLCAMIFFFFGKPCAMILLP